MSGSSGGSAGDSAAEAANFEDYESDAYNVTAGSTGHPTMTGDSNQVDWSPSDDTADTAGGYEDQGGPASRTDVSSIHGESDDPGSVSYDPSIAAAQEREAEHLATGDADYQQNYSWIGLYDQISASTEHDADYGNWGE